MIARVGIAVGLALHGAVPALAARSHLIVPGETLSEIAEVYGVSLASLVAANAIAEADLIYAGAELVIPEDPAGNPFAAPGRAGPPGLPIAALYRVQDGDTLDGIAALFGVSPEQLWATNPEIADPDLIFAGQVLWIPGVDIAGLLVRHATAYGLDPALLQALAWQESGWRQSAVSAAGAIGVMQLLPETGAWLSREVVGAPLDITASASDNIQAGAAFLRWLLDRTGSEELALIYYFQGEGSVARDGVYPATWAYVASVLAIRQYITRHGVPPPS